MIFLGHCEAGDAAIANAAKNIAKAFMLISFEAESVHRLSLWLNDISN